MVGGCGSKETVCMKRVEKKNQHQVEEGRRVEIGGISAVAGK
jgi:hypothetical protein